MSIKNADSERLKNQAIWKSIYSTAISLQSEVETLWAKNEGLERMTDRIIAQCSVSPKPDPKFDINVNDKVSTEFKPSFDSWKEA